MSDNSETKNQTNEETVITPGGPRPKSAVHQVTPGQIITGTMSDPPIVFPGRTRSAVADGRTQAIPPEYVLTPGGFRDKAYIHRVEPGQIVRVAADKLQIAETATNRVTNFADISAQRGAVPGLGSGWIAYASWNNSTGDPISSFTTTWIVPPPPATSSGQVIYLFNGIQESANGPDILQPVLQWGDSEAGGGNFWSITNWFVSSTGNAFYMPLQNVNPGDTIVGVITLTGQNGTSFSYKSAFTGYPNTDLIVQNIAQLFWSCETLECYNIQQCSDYPATSETSMESIAIQTGAVAPNVSWTPTERITDCGQAAVVVSRAEVDLYYGSRNLPGSVWTKLGSPTSSILGAPVAGRNKDGRIEVFAVNPAGTLWHIWQTAPNNGWSAWTQLPTATTGLSGPPASVVQNQDGRIEVFAMAASGNVFHVWQTAPNNGWSKGASLSSPTGGIIGSVKAGINADGRIELFGIAQDRQLWHIWQTLPNNGWSGWAALGKPPSPPAVGDPQVVTNKDGRLEVFVLSQDNNIYHIWQTAPNNGWSSWGKLGNPGVSIANGTPFVGRNADGRLELFVTGANGMIYHIWQTAPNNGWSGWTFLAPDPGGIQLWGLGAVSNEKDGSLSVFTIGSDGALWNIRQSAPNSGWASWNLLGGTPPANQALNADQVPAVGVNADGRLEAFVRGADGALWHVWESSPGGSW